MTSHRYSSIECFDWTSTEEFSEDVVFPAFKTPPRCCVHGNVNGCPQGRFLLLTRRQSIRLGCIMWWKNCFQRLAIEPHVNSNNGHSNCHSRWRRPYRFCYWRVHSFKKYSFQRPANWTKRLASYMKNKCCTIKAPNVQKNELDDWQAEQ